jgi:hypothetical protein
MEDDLNIYANGREPALFGKMEDDLNFREMEEDLNLCATGSRQYLSFTSKS